VIGQDAVVRSLKGVLAKGSNRTFLFEGPTPGIGKTSLARIAAAQVGSQGSDIIEIDAASFTGIDDMRQITSGLQYKPLGINATRSIILDECHRISGAAWASLLKSLEEPPAWVYWFLCTTDEAKVPANIKTRCTTYHLKPVPSADIFDLLVRVAEAEKWQEPADADKILNLCAKEAQGSPRAALVNLGACWGAKGLSEAQDLLKTAQGSVEAVELARGLLKGKGWPELREILAALKEQNPESVRHVVRGYMTSVIMSGKGDPERAFAILDTFSVPFASSDGLSPLVLAVGKLVFAD